MRRNSRFRNGVLGDYLAYATDSSRAVVVRCLSDTLVVSPADSAAFVSQVYGTRIPRSLIDGRGRTRYPYAHDICPLQRSLIRMIR